MDDFAQTNTKPKKSRLAATVFRGYRRLFVLVFAVALLWQVVSLVQLQLQQYHRQLVQDFKIILPLTGQADNEALAAMGESLSTLAEVTSVKLFSPQDGLTALQARNARLASALVALGREQMPAYFELKLTNNGINTITSLVQQLQAQYPQLSVKYAPQQAQLAFYTGLCLRTVNLAAGLALVLFIAFMFLVEAYPVRGKAPVKAGVVSALVAWALSLGFVAAVVYPAGVLAEALQTATSVERQLGLLVFCGLLGWTVSKWQKF